MERLCSLEQGTPARDCPRGRILPALGAATGISKPGLPPGLYTAPSQGRSGGSCRHPSAPSLSHPTCWLPPSLPILLMALTFLGHSFHTAHEWRVRAFGGALQWQELQAEPQHLFPPSSQGAGLPSRLSRVGLHFPRSPCPWGLHMLSSGQRAVGDFQIHPKGKR